MCFRWKQTLPSVNAEETGFFITRLTNLFTRMIFFLPKNIWKNILKIQTWMDFSCVGFIFMEVFTATVLTRDGSRNRHGSSRIMDYMNLMMERGDLGVRIKSP